MEKIELFNTGKRDITFAGGSLLAGKASLIPADEAKKLLALYEGEVMQASDFFSGEAKESTQALHARIAELEAEVKALKEAKGEDDFDPEKLKVPELKEILEKAGIKIPEGALKADLVALVQGLEDATKPD